MRRFQFLTLLVLALFTPAAAVPLRAQQNPEIEYLRYDVNIEVQENGDFLVRETQQVRYRGEFSQGYAEVPLAYVTDISGVAVYGGADPARLMAYEPQGSGPNSYTWEQNGDSLFIDWTYEPTVPGDELTFVVQYRVEGGLWIYPAGDSLEWRAVPADRSGLDVPASQVTVQLPFDIAQSDLRVDAFGPAYSDSVRTTAAGTEIILTAQEPIPDGLAFQILVELPHGLLEAVSQPWQIGEDKATLVYRLPAVDVQLSLDKSGTLHVVEDQSVRVVEGTMVEGFRRYTWLFLEGLDQLQVREGDLYYNFVGETELTGCQDCFTLTSDSRLSYWADYDAARDEVDINEYAAGGGAVAWRFPPLVKGEETTFSIEFDAQGTVSVNEDSQKLHWTILPGFDIPVEQTSVFLSLPDRLGLEDVTIDGPGEKEAVDGGILLTLDEPATDWAIQVTLPPGTTTAEKPSWQGELEAVYAEAEAYRERLARERIILTGAGVLGLVLLLLGVLVAWYLKWSFKWREIRGNYRTSPPSDLSPALVAYLIDEKATAKGALSALFHLATLGLLRIDLRREVELQRVRGDVHMRDQQKVLTPTGQEANIKPHMAYLYNALVDLLPQGKTVALVGLTGRLKSILPELYTQMGQDLAMRYHKEGGLRKKSKRPKRLFFSTLALLLALAFIAAPLWNRLFVTPAPSAPIVVLLMLLLFGSLAWWLISAQRSPSFSSAAQAERKRWLGFKAYLQDIDRYGDLEEAQEILDRYFDYAVALDIDDRFLQQIREMGGLVPIWLSGSDLDDGTTWRSDPALVHPFSVRPWYRRGSWNGKGSATTASAQALASQVASDGRPSLQRLSDTLTDSLSGANQRLTGLLNTTVGEGSDPVKVNISAFGSKIELSWQPGTPVDQVIGDIMRKSQTLRPPRPARSSGGGYRGGSGGSSFRGSSRGGSSSRSRSSGSRRSGGGGRRGFR